MGNPERTRVSTAKVRLKVMQCRVCGKDMTVGSNTRKAPRCIECGVSRAISQHIQMANRSGPEYEKWRSTMLEMLAR